MLGAIAQFETEIRSERQMEGIKKAQNQGIIFGRQKRLTQEQIVVLKTKREAGVKIKDIMKEYHLSKASVYRYLSALSS